MAKNQGKVGEAKSAVIRSVPLACSDEQAAVEFFERQRWGDAPRCPRENCGSGNVYQMADRDTGKRNARFLWRCKGCKRQFTVKVGTVMEDSKIALRHWAYAMWMATSSKKGVSSLQIKRQTGVSYESALFMMHRIRFAMADKPDAVRPKLTGTTEADETYVGGKPRAGDGNATRADRKTAVFAVLQRGGDVRAWPIERVDSITLGTALRANVDKSARLITDEHAGYRASAGLFRGGHETVCHSADEYVRGDVHTNTVEGFFSLLKRGMYGTFHSVSKHHLHRYVAEFQFRYNTRKMNDGERLTAAIRRSQGKRLAYQTPTCGSGSGEAQA